MRRKSRPPPASLLTQTARLGFSFSLLPPTLLVLVWCLIGPTTTGRIAALATLCLCLMLLTAMWRPQRRLALATLGLVFVAGGAWCVRKTPSTRPTKGPLGTRYLGTGFAVRTYLPRLVPEADQVYLGTLLVPFFDPAGFSGARRLRQLEMAGYQEMAKDPAFDGLASTSEMIIDDMLFLPFDNGHVFEYTPPHAAHEKLPAVIFLHGSLGNFKVYFWEMKRFADRYHCIVVLPSFGAGNWQQPGGEEAIERARQHTLHDLPVDPARLFLVGLSNGGRGVSRAALANPNGYAGVGYLSGVLEEHLLQKPELAAAWRDRPVLILYGTEDDRISAEDSHATADLLQSRGVRVTEKSYPKEDHFLFLSQPDSVLAEINRWMKTKG